MSTSEAQALKEAVALIGGPAAVASLFDPPIRSQAVSQWQVVPPERVLPVARACGFRVTPHRLRPDIYPNATDGLPGQEAA